MRWLTDLIEKGRAIRAVFVLWAIVAVSVVLAVALISPERITAFVAKTATLILELAGQAL